MSQFSVTKEVEFDMGQRVPNHKSKCANPHGHRYTVQATCRGDLVQESGASDEGMVLDFGDIKKALVECIHDKFDHSFTTYVGDREMEPVFALALTYGWKWNLLTVIPTAENLAKLFFEILQRKLPSLECVTVWETPTSSAQYPA